MPKKLRRLRIEEGSLVDRPANPGARVMLWKRHDHDDNTPTEAEMPTKRDDLEERVEELGDQIGALTKANADLTEALKAAQKGDPAPQPSETETRLGKQVEELTTKLKTAEEKLAKHEPPVEDDKIDLAALPAAVRRRLEDVDELRKSFEAEKKANAKLAEQREVEQSIAKLAKHWPTLPSKPESFGLIYHKIVKALEKDELAELERVFTSHAEFARIASAALGRDHIVATDSAMAEIEARAGALRKADPRLTQEQAIAEATIRFPDLYEKYREEQKQ